MPYLNYLFCEKCGPPAQLDVDYINTIQEYVKEGREQAVIDDRNFISDYLIYSCPFCQKKFKYGFEQVEKRVREFLGETAKKYSEKQKESRFDTQQKQRIKDMYSK